MIRRPPRSTLFPYTRSSDLGFGLSLLVPEASYRPAAEFIDSTRLGLKLTFQRVPSRVMPAPIMLNDRDRKSTRLNSSHLVISYAVFCLKKKLDSVTRGSIID